MLLPRVSSFGQAKEMLRGPSMRHRHAWPNEFCSATYKENDVKLLSFIDPAGRASWGVIRDDGVVDLGTHMVGVPTLKAALVADRLDEARAMSASKVDFPLSAITFDAVVPDPDKIICVGLNYRDHVAETGRTVTEKPTLFARFPSSQVGHDRPMIKPPESSEYDYEGELAVIISKGGRRITHKDALAHVAGYACYNEGSIRDWLPHTTRAALTGLRKRGFAIERSREDGEASVYRVVRSAAA